jgi:hypothetical protein
MQVPLVQVPPGGDTQALPLLPAGFEQTPVLGLQMPAAWQASLAEHETGLAPTQAPL